MNGSCSASNRALASPREISSRLQLRDVCRCEVEGCASFYTAMPMKRWFRRGKQVPVGKLVVDTIDGDIVYVEVLGRPDLKALLAPR